MFNDPLRNLITKSYQKNGAFPDSTRSCPAPGCGIVRREIRKTLEEALLTQILVEIYGAGPGEREKFILIMDGMPSMGGGLIKDQEKKNKAKDVAEGLKKNEFLLGKIKVYLFEGK